MKKAALLWQAGNEELGIEGKVLPTPEEMTKIINRDLEDENPAIKERLQDIFDWYVDSLVSCVAGSTYFGERVRRSYPISTAPHKDDHTLMAVHPTSEALAYVIYLNCYQKWVEMHKWRVVEKNQGHFPKYVAKDEDTHRFKARFSDSGSGNCPYGGWNDEGLKLFNDTDDLIRNGREKKADQWKAIEEACRQRLVTKFEEKQAAECQKKGIPVPISKKRKAIPQKQASEAAQTMKQRRRTRD